MAFGYGVMFWACSIDVLAFLFFLSASFIFFLLFFSFFSLFIFACWECFFFFCRSFCLRRLDKNLGSYFGIKECVYVSKDEDGVR